MIDVLPAAGQPEVLERKGNVARALSKGSYKRTSSTFSSSIFLARKKFNSRLISWSA
jgi:hypothetical protein